MSSSKHIVIKRPHLYTNSLRRTSIIVHTKDIDTDDESFFIVPYTGTRIQDEKAVKRKLSELNVTDPDGYIVWKELPKRKTEINEIFGLPDNQKSNTKKKIYFRKLKDGLHCLGCLGILLVIFISGVVIPIVKQAHEDKNQQCEKTKIQGKVSSIKRHHYRYNSTYYTYTIRFVGKSEVSEVVIGTDEVVPIKDSSGRICSNNHWHWQEATTK